MANWEEVLNEIAAEQHRAQKAFDTVRRKITLKATNMGFDLAALGVEGAQYLRLVHGL